MPAPPPAHPWTGQEETPSTNPTRVLGDQGPHRVAACSHQGRHPAHSPLAGRPRARPPSSRMGSSSYKRGQRVLSS